ncbi:hypothetical protein KAS08_04280 [Candidatus Pacearchaeota archaeon]|nr:hypothetical protein [Candidatus Pacearchaeota archaeon]
MKKEFNRIKKVSKKIVGKEHYKKIKKLNSYKERTEGLKYLTASKLELRHLELEIKLRGLEYKRAKLIEIKLILLPSKIKIFKSTFSKRDYTVVQKLIKEIEGELGNV